MQNKIKDKIISIGFVVILSLVFIINIIVKDKTISTTERRKLAQFPEITFKKLTSGQVGKEFEQYTLDQFIFRDYFVKIKNVYSTAVFKQKDTNGFFEIDGAIYKMEYPVNVKNIEKSADKIKYIQEKYLKDMKVYYSIIPDKNYYLLGDDHLKLDYNQIKEIMNNKLSDMEYIEISDCLVLEDFYKTDLHWKQERLENVVNKIGNSLNLDENNFDYDIINAGEFYGTYYSQYGRNLEPDNLYFLSNKILEEAKVYNYETQKYVKVYSDDVSKDKYDIYLHGATPLLTIENPNAKEEKELIIFRDSFGSSLTPLLIESYSKITLVDIRYISSQLLEKYIVFDDQDVLFIYSSLVLNQGVFK